MNKLFIFALLISGAAFAEGGGTPHPDPKYCPLCEAARIEKTFETSGESSSFGGGEQGKNQVGTTQENQPNN